jgi:hypothetical protein
MSQDTQQTPAQVAANANAIELSRREMMVEDNSQYSMLLDTRKFAHMQRVATLFAATALVPVQYQNNMADCFVAMQMAMRLGVDPLMFMQASYVVHGRPGMEAKFVIALINSSGMFVGPLRYALSGKGDDRGCEAYAIRKEDGSEVRGPRVDMKMAKAEGWTKNSKWQTMQDLMLTYRSAAFFGRTVCPERLMGMQTVEELEDVGPRLIESRVVEVADPGKSRIAQLNEKIRENIPQNVAAGQTASTQVEERVQNEEAGHQGENQMEQQQPGDDQQGQDQPKAPEIKNWSSFMLMTAEFCQDQGITEEAMRKSINLKVLGLKARGKEQEIPAETLNQWYGQMLAGQWTF